ncbi:MAG: T9SS C-terminal target domain-containing protein [Bacteroidetes bacterium]|nr:MAG: T9SS C-terminal target domain-containing protein [Bacteroidota bacterium]
MKITYLLCLLFSLHLLLPAQEGFIEIYDLGYSGSTFHNITLDQDTLLCVGKAVDSTTLLWGILFAKLDTNGQVLFQRLYLDPDGNHIYMRTNSSIIKTQDGGYAMCGHDYSHAYFLKIDNLGGIDLFKKYEFDALLVKQKKIIETEDGYLLCGTIQENNYSNQVYVKKIDKQGNELWEQDYGAPAINDFMNSFLKLDENTYVIGYGQSASDGTTAIWGKSRITAIDSLGNIKWEWASSPLDEFFALWGLNPTSDGGWIFICNYVHNFWEGNNYPNTRYRIVKLDSARDIEWTKFFGEFDNVVKVMVDLIPAPKGNYVGVGNYSELLNVGGSYSARTFKITSEGDSLWNRLDTVVWNGSDTSGWGEAIHSGIVVLPSGSTISCGITTYVNYPIARSYAFLIKLNKDGCVNPGCNPSINAVDWEQVASFNLFPNPANDWLKIEGQGIFDVEIFDVNGRLLTQKSKQKDVSTIHVDNWPNGEYFVRIRIGKQVVINKVLKI